MTDFDRQIYIEKRKAQYVSFEPGNPGLKTTYSSRESPGGIKDRKEAEILV
ncbi:hypothetical protein GCM10010917_28710 [Paenibacillus physcomitrellae]|uniref:Uncharacterized protein n=1 Tax=Paenibacillus physcomitrellae TaxID=1619311 RepID=A0ABQ1GDL0_9BACL|nr:hypothetical protein GCM10010917_28710 [Paenibacillus physcomitrellae]